MAFHSPYEIPLAVAVNGALMSSLWFSLPAHWKNALFSLHGTLAFAMVLAGWMISNVAATNVLATDARPMVGALDDPTAFRRLLYAKNIALWLLVAPICSLVALGIGVNNHDLSATVVSIVAIAILRSARSGCQPGWASCFRITRLASRSAGPNGDLGGT